MARMFDQLGGLDRLVKGKTVAVKINLIGVPGKRGGWGAARMGDVLGATRDETRSGSIRA